MTWDTRPLGEVAQINPRGAKPGAPFTFLGMADLSEDGSTSGGTVLSPDEFRTGYTPFANGDLLVAKITPCFENGKIGQVSVQTDTGWGSTEFHVVRPDDSTVDRRYLHHFLRTPRIRSLGEMRMTGSAGQRRVPVAFLQSLRIPLPPLPDQRRIAAILDEADAISATSRTQLEAVGRAGDELIHRILARAARRSTLRDLGVSFSSGLSVADGGMSPHPSNRILKVSAVSSGTFDVREVKSMPLAYDPPEAHRVSAGELLITRASGSVDLIARSTFVESIGPDVYLPDKIWRVTVAPSSPVSLEYIDSVTRLQEFREFIRVSSSGASGVRNVSQAKVLGFEAPVPTTGDHERIVEIARWALSERRRAGTRAREADALFASLQHRAFHGQL